MKNSNKQPSDSKKKSTSSKSVLNTFFIDSLQEIYYAENAISVAFGNIINDIVSPQLLEILKIHYTIHLKHKERIEKVFLLRNEPISTKNCEPINALLAQAIHHLSVFSGDTGNWEIALILVSQKLAYYKIASYGGLAHLAINLNYRSAAALLAFSVQEEEEFIANKLNGLIDAFLTSNVDGYKSELN